MIKTLITYGSKYGSTKHYALKLAELTNFPILPFREVRKISDYNRIIHFGALYAGGVMGLKHIVSMLPEHTELIIATVGLADVNDKNNTDDIKRSIQAQVPKNILSTAKIFHLRGAIDYSELTLAHRTMMALLCAKAKNIPQEKRTADVKALLETYGKRVSFVDDAALRQLTDVIK